MELKKIIVSGVLTSFALVSANSYATNGYAMHGIGTKSKAMAGSGAALAQDTFVMGMNPAGIVQVGKRLDAGAAVFIPLREFEVSGTPSGPPAFSLTPGSTESDSNYFLVPNIGYVAPIDSQSSWGIAAFGNGGMNTDYSSISSTTCASPPFPSSSGVFCDGNAGINLSQLFVTPSYARKITGLNASWGVSLVGVVQSFEAEGLAAFGGFSANPGKISGNGTDISTGIGFRLSGMMEFKPGLTGSVSVQPKINMSEFSDYKGLFADEGNFDIPENWNFALAWSTSNRSTLTFDIQHIKFSDVDSVGTSSALIFTAPNTPPTNPFGSDGGPGFGWDDMTIYKLGYQWKMANMADWTWRIGISHGEQPISDNDVTLNILAPAVVETHLTGGFTKAMGANNELSFSFMHAFSESVKGQNSFDQAQEVEIEMKQFEVELGYSWKF